jgi:hypothetical protein
MQSASVPLRAFLAVTFSAAFSALSAQTQVISAFDTSLEGWTHVAATAFQHQPSGGNPDGFMFVDNSEGQVCYVFAPAKFLGDLSRFEGGTIGFDGNMIGIGGSPWMDPRDYGHLRISGPGGSAEIDLEPNLPPNGSWKSYSKPLDAATWGVSPATWTAILANVSEIRLSVEALFGAEQHGIDNFFVESLLEPTYFCTAKTALVCGAAKMSFTGRSSATQTSGFTVQAAPARTDKAGILLYNTTKSAAPLPFEGGTLCIEPMGLRRAGPTVSMGTCPNASCLNELAIDMNRFASGLWVVPDCMGAPTALQPNFAAVYLGIPGTTVHAQFWGRDSMLTGSLVSEGLSYIVGP